MIIMFCSFEGPPKIVRLYGRGEVIFSNHREFHVLAGLFPLNPGTRSFIRMRVTRVSDSCGYGVPFYNYQGDRKTVDQWAVAKGPVTLKEYRKENNEKSVDGLPALENL